MCQLKILRIKVRKCEYVAAARKETNGQVHVVDIKRIHGAAAWATPGADTHPLPGVCSTRESWDCELEGASWGRWDLILGGAVLAEETLEQKQRN